MKDNSAIPAKLASCLTGLHADEVARSEKFTAKARQLDPDFDQRPSLDFGRIHRENLAWHELTGSMNPDRLAAVIDRIRAAKGLRPLKWPQASQYPQPRAGIPAESLTPWLAGRELPPKPNADTQDMAFYESLKSHPTNLRSSTSL